MSHPSGVASERAATSIPPARPHPGGEAPGLSAGFSDLELRGVLKRFGQVTAVDGLSLRVTKGEFVSLLGPSGCGKTTALRMIAGYEQPDEGDILIRGRSMTHVPPYRRNVGMVFQSYALFPHLTVSENVAFGLRERRRPREEISRRTADMLRLVHLEGMDERYPNQISGGQQQRVALARALVIEPEILLLDEPLSNLDAKLREEMRVEIKQLQASLGITTVFVTHDQVEALTLSSRIVVMSEGRMLQVGSPGEVYWHPRTRFTYEFLGGTNVLAGQVVERRGSELVFRTESGLTIVARQTGAEVRTENVRWLGVRPENVQLFYGTSDGPNCFPAVVENVLYRGWTKEILVRLASGDILKLVQVVSRGAADQSAETLDMQVAVGWAPENCYLLAEERG